MTLAETIAQANGDLHSSQLRNKLDAFDRVFQKQTRMRVDYPLTEHIEWTHPVSRNRWIFQMKAYSKEQKKSPRRAMACSFERPSGRYLLLPIVMSGHYRDAWAILPPHLFKRFRQRVLKDDRMPTNEVILQYITRNATSALDIHNGLESGIVHRYGERSEFTGKVQDGTVFGDYWEPSPGRGIAVFKTIVTEGMLYDNQHEAQDWLLDELDFLMSQKVFAK